MKHTPFKSMKHWTSMAALTVLISLISCGSSSNGATIEETESTESTETSTKKSNSDKDFLITISTEFGDMYAILYDETPKHKANFIKLAQEKFYDSLLFHRIIEGFMIQGGDPQSKNAAPGTRLGSGGPGYTVEAEIKPNLYHKKGAFSAARQGDNVNPERRSSGSQFYIVQGIKYETQQLVGMEQNAAFQKKNEIFNKYLTRPENSAILQQVQQHQASGNRAAFDSLIQTIQPKIEEEFNKQGGFSFSEKMKSDYQTIGGAPHLDGQYTVFGQVIKGLEIIDLIAKQPKDGGDRPTKDIQMTVTVEELSKSKITKLTGYTFE